MVFSILTPKPITSTSSPLFFSPLKPYPFIRIHHHHHRTSLKARNPNTGPRLRLLLRCAAAAATTASVFGDKRDLTGIQPVVDALPPPPARQVVAVVLTLAAAAGGYGIGIRVVGTRVAAIAGAAVGAAAAAAATLAVGSTVPHAAAARLRNLVAECDDIMALERGDVDAIVRKYGVSRQDEVFRAELCDLYSRFVSSVIPLGAEDLKGNEVETIIKFKEALGIDDPDAANVHLEIGRRLFRQRLETGDHEADIEQRRAFQKLIYVSNLVFGDASTFLLPWKRLFRVTDAQVDIAIRDNAKRLYAIKLESIGRDVEAMQLIDLRKAQLLYRVSDEVAAEMFREHIRTLIEENITSALDILKSRTDAMKDNSRIVEELDKVRTFNDLLTTLSKHPEAGQFAPGVGPVSVVGGVYEGERKIDDLRLLYRVYAIEAFPDGRRDEKKLHALNHLRNIFGLGKREAEAIVLDVTTSVYRKRLAKYFNKELVEAPSKAALLQNLCEELHFDPENASKLHADIYRQKLQQFVADGELSKEEVEALMAYQVRLCIPQETVDAANTDICGSMFEKVIKDAIASGINGFTEDVRAPIRKAAHGLRLTKEAAMDIVSKTVRKVFLTHVQRARGAGNRVETAKELKKIVSFNSLVVTPLLSDIKGEPITKTAVPPSDSGEEQTEIEEQAWESLQTLKTTKELAEKQDKPFQTEITLKDDLSYRERFDLYERYLLFCLSGDVTSVTFGAKIDTKQDEAEASVLHHLGAMLGLRKKDIVQVHLKLAEKAFIKQAKEILADGQVTKMKIDQLGVIQKQVGLPAELAQRVIKKITSTKMAAAIETAVTQGRLSIQEVRQLKESNVDLDSMISEKQRQGIFRKTVEEFFSSGKGVFDEQEVYKKLPADLNISAESAKMMVREIAKARLANSLVEAVALFRQRNRDGVVASLNDMLACDMAVPAEEPLSWNSPGELDDLYCIYMKSIPKPEKLSRLQYLLGISDAKASMLQDAATAGASPVAVAEEEEEELAF